MFNPILLVLTFFLYACKSDNAMELSTSPLLSNFPTITLSKFASGFVEPLQITNAFDGSGRIFIVEKKGIVKIIKNGTVLTTPLLDISSIVKSTGSEQGLLGLAFPPGYISKGYFYVNYINQTGIGNTVVERFKLSTNPDIADPNNGSILLTIAQPFSNHNGGQLAFGPDTLLYIGVGDGGSGGDPLNNAQNKNSLLGKILRLDVESGGIPYKIPSGNPFNTEVWAIGLRNPWRFSFDRQTSELYIADVGQDQSEEVNVQALTSSGVNYGWNILEGTSCFKTTNCNRLGLTLPVTEYDHSSGNCSITGGFVYRGTQFPSLQGIYLYGDFCSGKIWGLRKNGLNWESKILLDTSLAISSFGEDQEGNIFVADFANGDIYKVMVP